MPMAKTSVSNPSSPNPGGALGSMDEVIMVFKKFDKNGDGKISIKELAAALGELGGKISDDEIRRIMSEIDKDGNGFIDLDEFAEFHQNFSSTGGGSKDLQDAFDLFDVDKNGLISAKELHSVLKRLGEKCSLKDCCRMISSVDVDGDGHVNFEEFKKMMTRS
ncbi:probable calcium-binding protein CML23 [Cucurbita maxima]|uniref:Probable calcium-binding protein CML23 n=1 Tax=Cucurbita maxima TaxID=3661 RepID=A0A6J1KB05_CUCMA|nr:probable calcium-binding protein CML23 [Cucurbita maxima]